MGSKLVRLGFEPLMGHMTRCQYVVKPLWVWSSWGVLPGKGMDLSVTSRRVFFSCHYPEDKAV